MQPLAQFPRAERAQILGVLTDIDDTLTDDGVLTAAAYAALERLHDAGFLVIPITGRPAGWCDMIARFWPVDGVVGENGAFYFRYDHAARRMIRAYALSEAERVAGRDRLAALGRRIVMEVPGAAISADQPYRLTDLAIDFREDVPALDERAISRIVALFEEAGATAKVSSIHVNGWFGTFDKCSMAERILHHCFGHAPDVAHRRFVFVGDSPNDAPMFAAFTHGVGVANLRAFLHRLPHRPRWITPAPGGAGFAELADALLAARREG